MSSNSIVAGRFDGSMKTRSRVLDGFGAKRSSEIAEASPPETPTSGLICVEASGDAGAASTFPTESPAIV